MVAQVLPSVDVWIWYALPYAASQSRFTWVTCFLAPRSTRIHCGSTPSLLPQRVVVLPSKAFAGPSEELSTDEDVAGLPWERRVSLAAPAPTAMATVTESATTAAPVRPMSLPEIFTGAILQLTSVRITDR